MVRIVMRRLLPLAVVAVAASCARDAVGPRGPEPEAHFAGYILEVIERAPESNRPVRLLLGANQSNSAIEQRAIYQVGPDVELYRRSALGSLAPGTHRDLVVGARIWAWNNGVELRSLPPQYGAVRIETAK